VRPKRVVEGGVVIECALHLGDGGEAPGRSSSSRRVRWNRSILPVVVGERTAVSRWRIPFSGRSGRTGPRVELWRGGR